MKDYTDARYWAISGLGYGKGFTPEEAVENYVAIQLRNYRAKDTIFGTRPKFEAALREGEVKAEVWKAPEGTTGFVVDHRGLQWYDADSTYTAASEEHLVSE